VGSQVVREGGGTTLDGLVVMTLGAELPPVLAVAPGVDALSQRIMNTILEKLEVSLAEVRTIALPGSTRVFCCSHWRCRVVERRRSLSSA
jgi:hypothetical protein